MKNVVSYITAVILGISVLLVAVAPAKADEVIGTRNDISGYIVPDEEDDVQSRVADDPIRFEEGGSTAYNLIFSIQAREVTDILASDHGDKSFTRSTLPDTATTILCRGTLFHSLGEEVHGTEPLMYGGICYWGYSYIYDEYVYIGVISYGAEHGKLVHEEISIAGNIDSGVTYYSYVKNKYPAGYVYGIWSLYYY